MSSSPPPTAKTPVKVGDVVEYLIGNKPHALVVRDVEGDMLVAGFVIDDSPNAPFVRGIEQGDGPGRYRVVEKA